MMAFDPNLYKPGTPPWLEGKPEQPRGDVAFGSNRGPRERRRTMFSFDFTEAWEKRIGWLFGR